MEQWTGSKLGKEYDKAVHLTAYLTYMQSACMHAKLLQFCPTLCDPMAPLSMEFSRQKYWIGLPFPSPGDLPYPGVIPESLKKSPALASGFFTTRATWEALV